jgi:hypothetical protein
VLLPGLCAVAGPLAGARAPQTGEHAAVERPAAVLSWPDLASSPPVRFFFSGTGISIRRTTPSFPFLSFYEFFFSGSSEWGKG